MGWRGVVELMVLMTQASPPSSPCRGQALELSSVEQACTVAGPANLPPPADALAVDVAPEPLKMKSGDVVDVTVTLKNTTSSALTIDLDEQCSAFQGFVEYPDGGAADPELQAFFMRTCAPPHTLRVTLEPQGSLSTRVSISALRTRVDCGATDQTGMGELQNCTIEPGANLRPGRYRVRVWLPFEDPPRDGSASPITRSVWTELRITR